MPRLDYKRCRNCGRFSKDVGEMSHTRLCPICGIEILTENVTQLVAHDGPRFKEWRRGMAASVGAVLLDDITATP
jgi:hypothetical protein